MIYYFSGTGNSKWVAETLSKNLNEKCVNLASLPLDTKISLAENEILGLVFPTYSWDAPFFIKNFVKKISLSQNNYLFAITTCGAQCGVAMQSIEKVIPLNLAASISLPNNWIQGSNPGNEKLFKKKIGPAKQQIELLTEKINQRLDFQMTHKGLPDGISKISSFAFNHFMQKTKKFSVTENCNGCGLCAKNCPAQAIEMTNGRPVWIKDKCYQCTACINRCPQEAIQYGKLTKKRNRYYFEKFTNF